MPDTVKSFSAMLREALGDRLAPDAGSFVDMFHAEGVMEFPYAFGDLPRRVVGREALERHLSSLAEQITFDRISEPTVIETLDRDTVILEFEAFGSGVATDEPYEQRYVSIIRTQGGTIVHYKDYWNSLAVLRALRGSEQLALLTHGEAHHG
ncbi:nuclear transport factor 2 family protein [Methylobacterium oryzisoli]|uniref:nuclear transport factor 2 family protein n=1 Tax=Methylobacterium oryzisoli TaxID=3385502 RepID=UPI0038916EDD